MKIKSVTLIFDQTDLDELPDVKIKVLDNL